MIKENKLPKWAIMMEEIEKTKKIRKTKNGE